MKSVAYVGHINSILIFKHSPNIITNPNKCHTLLKDKLKGTNKKCLDPFKKTGMTLIYENNTHYEE
jgi:hypothetical protein